MVRREVIVDSEKVEQEDPLIRGSRSEYIPAVDGMPRYSVEVANSSFDLARASFASDRIDFQRVVLVDADTRFFIYIYSLRSMNDEGLKAPNAKTLCGHRGFDPLEKGNLPSAKDGVKFFH